MSTQTQQTANLNSTGGVPVNLNQGGRGKANRSSLEDQINRFKELLDVREKEHERTLTDLAGGVQDVIQTSMKEVTAALPQAIADAIAAVVAQALPALVKEVAAATALEVLTDPAFKPQGSAAPAPQAAIPLAGVVPAAEPAPKGVIGKTCDFLQTKAVSVAQGGAAAASATQRFAAGVFDAGVQSAKKAGRTVKDATAQAAAGTVQVIRSGKLLLIRLLVSVGVGTVFAVLAPLASVPALVAATAVGAGALTFLVIRPTDGRATQPCVPAPAAQPAQT